MTPETIDERVREIFQDVFDDETLIITRETTALDIEEWDSLAQITLVVAMEKEFGLKFQLNEIQGLANVGGMMDLIARKLA